MNATEAAKISPWIKNPALDLFFFSFGWLLVLAGYYFIDRSGYQNIGRVWLLNFVLLVAVFHRHLTFPLVYADPDQFHQRQKSYVWLPILFTLVTVVGYFYVQPAALRTETIPLPVQVSSGETLTFRVTDSLANEKIPVKFEGSEKTLEELASTFRRSLGDRFKVAVDGEKLKFTLNSPDNEGRFGVFRDRGSPEIFQSLGLGSGSIKTIRAAQPLLMALIVLSALWNFYHTLMQKMGILRIYSRKAAYGKSWLDKGMIWAWFAVLFFQLGSMPSVLQRISVLATSGKYLTETFRPFLKVFPYLAYLALLVALAVTALYLKEEWAHRDRLHWPKNIFLFSILALYSLFFYDFLIAYVAFGFSHAIEYLAFVNIFSRKKYLPKPEASSWMARWVHRQYLSMGIFVVASAAIFIPWHFLSARTLGAYILASSFLHFLYDGWIWKVRNPAVGKPLGIEYPPPAGTQVQQQPQHSQAQPA